MTIQSHKGPYTVHFDPNALESLNANVPADAHFLVDAHVAELYADRMAKILAHRSVLRIDAKETNKSLERMPDYVAHLVDKGLRRDQRLIAIGGGIIQDITCFLSATMLRGVDWVFYPTTLLAQADSCIGSKSSINSGSAKNILGTFTPPREVHISTDFLGTLDERDVRSGIGEMLKVHVIDGPDSFDRIAGDYARILAEPEVMMGYIRRSLDIKKAYIERDEFDQGPRNVFNYGHSFGHAIEAATDFAIPHGIAVTIGMNMANYVAAKLEVGSEENYQRMQPVMRKNYAGFETHPVPLDAFMTALSRDKKNQGAGSVTLILADRSGKVSRDKYPMDDTLRGICRDYLETARAAA
jgi:3-dehydroquinate synthase